VEEPVKILRNPPNIVKRELLATPADDRRDEREISESPRGRSIAGILDTLYDRLSFLSSPRELAREIDNDPRESRSIGPACLTNVRMRERRTHGMRSHRETRSAHPAAAERTEAQFFTRRGWKDRCSITRVSRTFARPSISDARCRRVNSIYRALRSESNVGSDSSQQHFLREQSVAFTPDDGRRAKPDSLPGARADPSVRASERNGGGFGEKTCVR